MQDVGARPSALRGIATDDPAPVTAVVLRGELGAPYSVGPDMGALLEPSCTAVCSTNVRRRGFLATARCKARVMAWIAGSAVVSAFKALNVA